MENPQPKKGIISDLWLVAELAWAIGWIVAIPAVALGFGGAYLDNTLGTTPLFIISGMLIAMGLSGYGLYRKLKEILSR